VTLRMVVEGPSRPAVAGSPIGTHTDERKISRSHSDVPVASRELKIGSAYAAVVADVFDRVRAMPVMAQLWPAEPGVGSRFAVDETRASVSTYTAARVLLLDAIHRLRAAAEMAENEALTEQGTHLLLLRPALVSTAKAAWVVGPEDSVERSTRAVRLVCEDHRQGALAMRKAVEQGAPAAFGTVASSFERSIAATLASLRVRSVDAEKKPPRDESLILNLGSEIDRYYGTNDASSDLQLLWNASSCLDHGERHHSVLTSRPSRAEVAKILTVRSFDGMCNGVNVTGLRLMGLAVSPAGS
jgi:hypothetical protein